VVVPKEPDAGPPLPPATYDARQRRDPFAPLVVTEGATKGLTVASVKLTGVILGGQSPLGLVEAPDGIGYILKLGDMLGNGRVVEIGKDTISFAVAGRPGQPASTVTLRLRTD
jgi:Tfp pilus assembly protein PilP